MRQLLATLVLLAAAASPCARGEQSTTSGYVTAIPSATEFHLNGVPVQVAPSTVFTTRQSNSTLRLSGPPALYLGELVEVVGDSKHKSGLIAATRINILPRNSAHAEGVGIIDMLPASPDPAGILVRADGYLLLLPASLKPTLTAPLNALSDIQTNQWIRYSGTQRADGIVVLDRVDISANTVNHREDHLRATHDYDPSVIDQGDAQSGASKFFRGKNPARLPAWRDAAMQARVERIGNSLIPAFQRSLSEDDPTRIDFRFQVTDEPKHDDAWSFSSGIILVPHQVVDRLPDDSQLAAILADSIAEVLEKQDLRAIPAAHKMTTASIAGGVAGAFIPGVGLVPMAANHEVAKSMQRRSRQQSGRVSLCLMHDAGYDLTAAPNAWWILHAKEGKEYADAKMPDHTLYLYDDLGTTWRSGLQVAPQVP